jgi:hypothetical protein
MDEMRRSSVSLEGRRTRRASTAGHGEHRRILANWGMAGLRCRDRIGIVGARVPLCLGIIGDTVWFPSLVWSSSFRPTVTAPAMAGKILLPGLTPTHATRSTIEIQVSCCGPRDLGTATMAPPRPCLRRRTCFASPPWCLGLRRQALGRQMCDGWLRFNAKITLCRIRSGASKWDQMAGGLGDGWPWISDPAGRIASRFT